ncbi:MAG: crossover junction endodeoxyribonuclease RuvC, partial [Proteobacteria bacterium]
GQGHATKDQVAAALKYLLGFDRGNLPHDASDAIAIALSHALSLGTYTAVASQAASARPPNSFVG